jgi:adenosine deaminase
MTITKNEIIESLKQLEESYNDVANSNDNTFQEFCESISSAVIENKGDEDDAEQIAQDAINILQSSRLVHIEAEIQKVQAIEQGFKQQDRIDNIQEYIVHLQENDPNFFRWLFGQGAEEWDDFRCPEYNFFVYEDFVNDNF